MTSSCPTPLSFFPQRHRLSFVCGCGLLFVLALSLSACKRAPVSARHEVQWKSPDGVELHATLTTPTRTSTTRPPGFILIHSLNRTRADWEILTTRLNEAGYLTLSFDIRGHGESIRQGGQPIQHQNFDPADWQAAVQDIAAAKGMLLDAGADPQNLFIIGSSLGANLGFSYAHNDSHIQGIVLLSPGLHYKTIDIQEAMRANRRLPVLLIASEGDSFSAGAIKQLHLLSSSYAETRTYSGSANGTDLLLKPQIIEDILLWLSPIVQ